MKKTTLLYSVIVLLMLAVGLTLLVLVPKPHTSQSVFSDQASLVKSVKSG